jgi:hypothetical protein
LFFINYQGDDDVSIGSPRPRKLAFRIRDETAFPDILGKNTREIATVSSLPEHEA